MTNFNLNEQLRKPAALMALSLPTLLPVGKTITYNISSLSQRLNNMTTVKDALDQLEDAGIVSREEDSLTLLKAFPYPKFMTIDAIDTLLKQQLAVAYFHVRPLDNITSDRDIEYATKNVLKRDVLKKLREKLSEKGVEFDEDLFTEVDYECQNIDTTIIYTREVKTQQSEVASLSQATLIRQNEMLLNKMDILIDLFREFFSKQAA